MSDVDTLIVMFQTQLSDVMDTLVKTAMRELTRLVEDGFVEEVRRRTRDAESLRAQLQWAEKKLSDAAAAAAQAGEEAPGPAGSGTSGGRCVDCGKTLCRGGDGTTGEAAEEEEEEEENIATELLQYGVLIGCDMKQEDDAMELCTGSHGLEVMSELAQEADVPVLVLSPVRESATMEQDAARPVVDVKKEEVNEPSCSAEHAGDWPVSHDVGSESHHGMGEWTDAQQQQLDHQTQQSSIEEEEEELLRTIIRQEEEEDPPQTIPLTHTRTSEDLRENEAQRALYACMLTDEPSDIVSPYDMDSGAQQVTSSSTLRPSLRHSAHEMGANGCEPAPKQTPIVSVRIRGRDHISSSDPPPPSRARQQFPLGGDMGTVVIKEEIIVNSDEGEEEMEEMVMMTTRPGLAAAPPSFTLNQYAPAQGDVSRKPTTAKEATKLHHSKVGSSTTLKAATVQHQHHQTAKKPNTTAHSLLASSSSRRTVSSSDTHSQAANQLNLQHRTPSTMSSHKGIGPPPLLTFQTRAQTNEPTNKRVLALTRASSIPWVSIKTHHHHHQQQQSSALHSQQNLLHHHHGGGTTTTHSSGSSSPHNNTSSSHLLRCGQCGKCFPHPSNLKAHVQTHTGERPFCCSLCGRSFTKLSNLKAHRRVHTGERPYCCLACGKRFTQKCNLKRHQRVHIDV